MIVIPDVREPVAIMITETSSSEGSAIISDDAYTFADTTEGFYTPWGSSAINDGLSYFKLVIGAVGFVALFLFIVPYAVELVTRLFNDFKNNFKG